jgi:hypothetical protein
MLVAIAAIVLGLVLGVGLAWLALSGLLAVAFRRARTFLRRMTQRRQSPRPDSPERRTEERRAH